MINVKVTTDFSGLDKLKKKLEKVSSPQKVPLGQLFNGEFMRESTHFGSFDELVAASGFKADTVEDFKAIPDAEWDAFIARATEFSSWKAMQQAAAARWMKNQLEL